MEYFIPSVALCFTVCISLLPCSLSGCGSGEEAYSVQGGVKFGSESVTEGTVTFEESNSKSTVQAVLGADGNYSVRLAEGTYKVVVEPPMVAETRGSDAGVTYKNVKNIPNKFRQSMTSPLSTDVKADTTFDIDLKK